MFLPSHDSRRAELRIALLLTAVVSVSVWGPFASAQEVNSWQGDPRVAEDWFYPPNWTFGVPNTQLFSTIIDNNGTARISAGAATASSLRVGLEHSGNLILDRGSL